MKLLILAAAFLAAVNCVSLPDDVEREFQEWKVKYGKVYSSPEEEAYRKDIWLATREAVLAHNARADAGKESYWQELNQFADMLEFGEVPKGLLPLQAMEESQI